MKKTIRRYCVHRCIVARGYDSLVGCCCVGMYFLLVMFHLTYFIFEKKKKRGS